MTVKYSETFTDLGSDMIHYSHYIKQKNSIYKEIFNINKHKFTPGMISLLEWKCCGYSNGSSVKEIELNLHRLL